MPLATSFLRAFAPGRLNPPVLPTGCDELRGALQRADLQEEGGERDSALEFSLSARPSCLWLGTPEGLGWRQDESLELGEGQAHALVL